MGALARSLLLLAALSAFALIAPVAASPAAGGAVRAGVAAVDASWHVGASAGQYATTGSFVGVHGVDPTTHSYRKNASYGIQSRLSARAIVVEGTNGTRIALVKNDLYIPQDLLYRRTAQLLEQGDSGITRANLTMAVTHDHSSPYYSSTSWGAWAFQDVYDVRFFDYYAKRMAQAVERAADSLVPVRIGASVSTFDKTHRHSYGPEVADDGTPAGYPNSETDHDLTVVRFDDVSDAAHPKPLANLVNFSLHPEMLSGNDLISADYVAPMQRMVDRETGGLTIYTQGAVGTAEPERSTYHSVHERLEFTHREYAQAEYGARLMSDAIVDTWRDVERQTPDRPDRFVPFQDRPVVANGGPVVPRSHLASVSRRLQLPDRQDGQRGRAVPGRGPARLRERRRRAERPRGRARRGRAAEATDRAGRPGHLDRRLPGPRHPSARELLRSFLHGAGGGRQHPPPGLPAGRDPLHRLLVRAVVRPVPQYQDADRQGAGQRVARLQLGGPVHLRRRLEADVDLSRSAQPVHEAPADPDQELPEDEGAGQQPRQRLERPVVPSVGRVGADGPDQDQGQLHARRTAARRRLWPDRADLHGERLQRLYRQLPRVPARRPLPQGADRLGAALQ